MAKSAPKRTWKYSKSFIKAAVELSDEPRFSVSEVAMNLDLHPVILYRWRKQYRDLGMSNIKGKPIPNRKKVKELTKMQELEREVALLKKENDLLKKWQRYLSEAHQNDLDSSKNSD